MILEAVNYILDVLLNDSVNKALSTLASFTTLIAFIIALRLYWIWKNQQKYSLKFSSLIELELTYDVWLHSGVSEFPYFMAIGKLDYAKKHLSSDVVKDIRKQIKAKSLQQDSVYMAKARFEFEIALLKVKKLELITQTPKSLDVNHLSSITVKYLNLIQECDFSDEKNEAEINSLYAHEIHSLSKSVYEEILKIKSSL
jgi:hypothetical protein